MDDWDDQDEDDSEIDVDAPMCFNGVDARTGAYLFDPLSPRQLADVAAGLTLDSPHQKELEDRHARQKSNRHWGVIDGIDPTKLDEAGWGVVFPATKPGSEEAAAQAEIYAALAPLLDHRRAQATKIADRYKEYRGPEGYRPGESKQRFMSRLGVGPNPADPDKVPYYLLLVGSPSEIPFRVQYQIDVQYAVGRIHFDTVEAYANYARSVVEAETGAHTRARELAFVGVANPDDPATQLSRDNLVAPLAEIAEGFDEAKVGRWKVSRYFDERADKAHLARLLGGDETPALLFTASHGMGFAKDDPLQRRRQGALLVQDWPGPQAWREAIGEDFYFSADDLSRDADLRGLISFHFACYGGGTPHYDQFAKQAFNQRKQLCDAPFVAELPRALLGHPARGALASIAHIDRTWGYSFMWTTGKRRRASKQLAVFQSAVHALMAGKPVGVALEYFNARYAELAADLSANLEELEWDPDAVSPHALAGMWTANNDARGYAIVGDPAVRLPLEASDEG